MFFGNNVLVNEVTKVCVDYNGLELPGDYITALVQQAILLKKDGQMLDHR